MTPLTATLAPQDKANSAPANSRFCNKKRPLMVTPITLWYVLLQFDNLVMKCTATQLATSSPLASKDTGVGGEGRAAASVDSHDPSSC